MRELIWKPGQAAELSVLGEGASPTPETHAVSLLEFSGKRIRVAAESPLKSGVPVRLEWDGQLLLGLVMNSDSGGSWIEIHHMLLDSPSLSWRENGWNQD
jgi:hypothetical protein